jgi:hypothetical protein
MRVCHRGYIGFSQGADQINLFLVWFFFFWKENLTIILSGRKKLFAEFLILILFKRFDDITLLFILLLKVIKHPLFWLWEN